MKACPSPTSRLLLLMASAVLCWMAACSSPVTDVGNPTISDKPPASTDIPGSPSAPSPENIAGFPTVSDLVGAYQLKNDTPATTDLCPFIVSEIPQIVAGDKPTEIILHHFLAFSAASDSITTDYASGSGLFSITDTPDNKVCVGSAKFVSSTVQVSLECKIIGTDASNCTSVFVKVSK